MKSIVQNFQNRIAAWWDRLNNWYLTVRYRKDWLAIENKILEIQERVAASHDIPAGTPFEERRQFAEHWFNTALSLVRRQGPQDLILFALLPPVELEDQPGTPTPVIRTCARKDWWDHGVQELLDILDTWPTSMTVYLYVMPAMDALWMALQEMRAERLKAQDG
ncbi:MAG: hypothetical protein KatS3mg057_1492 [Herpetosiphonaceae bacterium]|nr:MAG: hypothetical protein KatS3mg057_1492 [Herpetosiphonaceae bacterium]